MSNCIVCESKVNWSEVNKEFEHLFERADLYGMQALTEREQTVVEGLCCKRGCYEQLK